MKVTKIGLNREKTIYHLSFENKKTKPYQVSSAKKTQTMLVLYGGDNYDELAHKLNVTFF